MHKAPGCLIFNTVKFQPKYYVYLALLGKFSDVLNQSLTCASSIRLTNAKETSPHASQI